MSGLWLAYDNCRLDMASGQNRTKTIVMAIDPGEIFGRFLHNYRSDSFAAWHIAKEGPSDHEAMETSATAAVCIAL